MLILQLVLRPQLGVELTQGRSSSSCYYGILCSLQRPCLHGRVLGEQHGNGRQQYHCTNYCQEFGCAETAWGKQTDKGLSVVEYSLITDDKILAGGDEFSTSNVTDCVAKIFQNLTSRG